MRRQLSSALTLFPLLMTLLVLPACAQTPTAAQPPQPIERDPWPFGEGADYLDRFAIGKWWEMDYSRNNQRWLRRLRDVPREEALAFVLYTHQDGVLKLTAQCYPLLPTEPQEVTLEFQRDGQWVQADTQPVQYPGWSAHFRVEDWDNTQNVRYRVRLGRLSAFTGLIRRDPIDQDTIVVASLSCNSNRDRGDRARIVANLLHEDPDLLFFAGDQSYDHNQHTAAWLLWGRQFRDVLRDRPVVTIPDDHDIGQPNLWGEGGRHAERDHDGGYVHSPIYVNMVERCQTWHLPDPYDPTPIQQDIGVYYTSLNVGGIDFAIIEDRKFKSGPNGKIPQMGPRPDHINDPSVDVSLLDQPGLVLLGERQLNFLSAWGQDWTDVQMKCVLSQTNFCGAVTHHGNPNNWLVADLDSNSWPQSGRNEALRAIRRATAVHLAGDQHLAVVTQHGIDEFRDGPFTLVSPAIVNNYYGRWWMPTEQMQAGQNPLPAELNPAGLPSTGDYFDGLRNRITMYAYVNPHRPNAGVTTPNGNGAGYAIARFHKPTQTITLEAWSREADVPGGDGPYAGFPITIHMNDNDGREPVMFLQLEFDYENPVVQVVEDSTGEVLYTRRIVGDTYSAPVYSEGSYTVRAGVDVPDTVVEYTADR